MISPCWRRQLSRGGNGLGKHGAYASMRAGTKPCPRRSSRRRSAGPRGSADVRAHAGGRTPTDRSVCGSPITGAQPAPGQSEDTRRCACSQTCARPRAGNAGAGMRPSDSYAGTRQPFVLVLDDIHLVTEMHCHTVIGYLAEWLPIHCQGRARHEDGSPRCRWPAGGAHGRLQSCVRRAGRRGGGRARRRRRVWVDLGRPGCRAPTRRVGDP